MQICGVDVRYFCGVLVKKDVSNANLIDYTKTIDYSGTINYEKEEGTSNVIDYSKTIDYSATINFEQEENIINYTNLLSYESVIRY